MKKKNFLLAVSFMLATVTQAQPFGTAGGAAYHANSFLNLVPGPYNNDYRAGAGWSQVELDFTKSFKIDFSAMFHSMVDPNDPSPDPQPVIPTDMTNDGFVVVFGSNINTGIGGTVGGASGDDMGYYSPVPGTSPALESNSIGVEFILIPIMILTPRRN